jgi:hypothetical protein
LWQSPGIVHDFRSAVSLHGHTDRSQESLSFIVEFASKRPLLRRALARQERRSQRIRPDFFRAYWTPPLTPRQAYETERNQIERVLALDAMISMTDHDTLEAPLLLQLVPGASDVPLSLEWSVPFGRTVFHLGVHNLPQAEAASIFETLAGYTGDPREERLGEILALLDEVPDTLVVLNHPMWDLPGIGRQSHLREVERFLGLHNSFLHAFELGGLRGWRENQRVAALAQAWNQPVIAGGDRHGSEPSATLNLTCATTFSEFVAEVRRDRQSHVLFMPQYRQPVELRTLHTFLDVIREYPGHPRGARWDDRVFHPDENGEMRPLSALWEKPPQFIESIFALFRLLEWQPLQSAFTFLGRSRGRLRLPLSPGGETA